MTKLIERISIEIEFDEEPSTLYDSPHVQLKKLWPALGSILDVRGKWSVSGPGVVCHIINLGCEEVPEEGGGDN